MGFACGISLAGVGKGLRISIHGEAASLSKYPDLSALLYLPFATIFLVRILRLRIMKGLTLLAVLPATVWAAAFPQADYDSGLVHERIMKSKHVRCALYNCCNLPC